jgi:hypothetical protein
MARKFLGGAWATPHGFLGGLQAPHGLTRAAKQLISVLPMGLFADCEVSYNKARYPNFTLKVVNR